MTAILVGALLGLVVVAIAVAFLASSRPASAPPNVNLGAPLVGNYIGFAKNPVAFIAEAHKAYGPVFTVGMLHKKLTFLIGPEASAPFFKATDAEMSQPEVYGFMRPVFGANVVYDAPPAKRRQQMQHMSTNLKSNKLRAYVPKIEAETLDYLQRWGQEGEVDLLEALSELTILTASRCLHGDDVREELFEEVSRLYYDLDKGITPLSFFWPTAPTAAHAKRDAARKEMVAIFSKVIAARRARGVTSEESTDILQVFMDLVYKDGTVLTDDEITGLLIALLFAGQHTSSISSTWTALYLIANRGCLDRAMAEQEQVLGTTAGSATLDFDTVAHMEYLQNCVKEALRLHPPLIMLMRMAKKDAAVTANGRSFTVPKGDIVITSPAVAMRLGDVYTNPDTFDPDRFSEGRAEHKAQPFAYLGFGGGAHACMGQQFGLLQVKTIVSILVRNYELEIIEPEFPQPDYTAMVVGPKEGHCKVRYRRKATA